MTNIYDLHPRVNGSVACVEAGAAIIRNAGVHMAALRIAFILGPCYPVAMGIALGFAGNAG